MPPDAIASSEWPSKGSSSGCGLRRYWARRKSSAIACGNLGARPKPPHSGSYSATRLSTASMIVSSVGSSPGSSCAIARIASVSRSACSTTSSRRSRQASAAARPTSRSEGRSATTPRGEVRPAEEGPPVRGEEHGHGPPSVPGQRRHRVHVDRIDLRVLFAIHLHVHEEPVQLLGRRFSLEGLVRHDVAPVTRRVADREQDRPVLRLCLLEGLGAPRVPVDGVVGVLAEVRRGLVSEAVHATARYRWAVCTPGSAPIPGRSYSSAHGAPTGWEGRAGHRRLEGDRAGRGCDLCRGRSDGDDLAAGRPMPSRRPPRRMEGEVSTFAAHAGRPEEIEACVAACVERFGGIDILVNNAGTNPYMGPSIDIDLPALRQDLRGEPAWAPRLDAAGVARVDGRAGWLRHQHGLDRRALGRADDRHLQRHQGGGDPPHPHHGRGAGADGAGQRDRPRPGEDRHGASAVGACTRR